MSGTHTHICTQTRTHNTKMYTSSRRECPSQWPGGGGGGGGNWHVGGLSAIAPRQLHFQLRGAACAQWPRFLPPPPPPPPAQRSALKSVCWCSHCLVLGSRDGTTPACRPRCLIWFSLFPAARSPLFPVPSFLTSSCVAGAAHSPRSSDTMTLLVGLEERAMNERDTHRFR